MKWAKLLAGVLGWLVAIAAALQCFLKAKP